MASCKGKLMTSLGHQSSRSRGTVATATLHAGEQMVSEIKRASCQSLCSSRNPDITAAASFFQNYEQWSFESAAQAHDGGARLQQEGSISCTVSRVSTVLVVVQVNAQELTQPGTCLVPVLPLLQQ
eukprot:1859544-Amphidinium_carterae.1